MAIGRISGQLLQSNLQRSGVDLAFDTSLLYLNVSSHRIGINTASPGRSLDLGSNTDALRLPSGTNGQRGGATNGDIRYNTDLNTIEGYSAGAWTNLATGTKVSNTSGTTYIQTQKTLGVNEIDFVVAGTQVATMNSDGSIDLNNLQISGQTINGLASNADINLTTQGTGNINLNGTGIRVGDQNTNTTVTTYGSADLTLNTNGGTNSGSIKIVHGTGGNISILNSGAGGKLIVSGAVSTNGSSNLVLSTNGGTNTGSITIANGTNGNITIAPQGTGTTNINSNVTVTGNLQVNGTTTTVNSTTVTIADPILLLGAGNSLGAANTYDQGLLIDRGANENTAFVWKESAGEFVVVNTTQRETGSNITIDSYANFHAATIIGDTFNTSGLSINGNTISAAGSGNVDINLSPLNSGLVQIAAANITGGNINGTAIGSTTASTGKFTTVDTSGKISLNANSSDSGSTNALRIGSSQQIKIYHDGTNAHISNNSGILRIDGQTTSSIKINAANADVDFIVQGESNNNLFFVDAENNKIGISTATPGYILDIGSNSTAVLLPQGNSAARPTPATGVIRFNTETGYYEGCTDGTNWSSFGMASAGGAAPTISTLTATGDGSTNNFVGFFAVAPAAAANVFVFIDNVYQYPGTNYTTSGTTLEFSEAPYSGAKIFALAGFDNTALVTGGVLRSQASNVSVTSSPTDILTFNQNNYRSAEVYVQVDNGAGAYSVVKANVVHNGTSAAAVQTYGGVDTGSGQLVTLTATWDASTVHLQAATASGSATAKVQYTLSPV